MNSWDSFSFKRALNKIKKKGSINNNDIKTKENIYDYLASELAFSRDTVKGWSRPTSNGPKDEKTVRTLEKLIGVKRYEFEDRKEIDNIMNDTETALTDINKQAIFTMYKLMKDYLLSDKVEDEDHYSEMWSELETQKLLVPTDLCDKVSDFVNENLEPIVSDPEKTFEKCYDKKFCYLEDGSWHVKDEASMKQIAINYYGAIFEILDKLEAFAQKEMRPYLL